MYFLKILSNTQFAYGNINLYFVGFFYELTQKKWCEHYTEYSKYEPSLYYYYYYYCFCCCYYFF